MNMRRILEQKHKVHFENESQKYIINENYSDYQILDGLVTNPSITKDGNLHFHSLTKFKRGDLINVEGAKYLINSDVIRHRGVKYKGIGEYCNWNHTFDIIEDVIIGVDNYGRPIYEKQKVGEETIYGILKNKELGSPNQDSIVLPNSYYNLIVKDEPIARKLLDFNKGIKIEGLDYNVFHVAYDKNGILFINLRFGSGE